MIIVFCFAKDKSQKLKGMADTSSMCREKFHENELLTFYCEQSKVCICEKCRQTRHNHHTAMDIHQAAEQHKVDIEEIVQEMKIEIAEHEGHAEKTKNSLRKSRGRIAAARNKVMTSVEELIRLLHEHEKAIITSLDVIDGKEERQYSAQLEHLQISRNQLQEHVDFWQDILLRKKSVEILQAHHALIGRCRGLLQAEKLNIYKPLHVKYEINNEYVEKVTSAVPAVGRVVIVTTDPLQSVAEGPGLQEVNLGSEATFKITTKDSDGNKFYDENDQIQVKVQSPSGEELTHLISTDKDGEYSVTYTPDCLGQHEVTVMVNGQPLTGSPWNVYVTCVSQVHFTHQYTYSFRFGSSGNRQGTFCWPSSIATDSNTGNFAVADQNRVQLFSAQGTYPQILVAYQLNDPTSVAFTKSSELLVIASHTISCYSRCYKFRKYVINKKLQKPKYLNIASDGRMMVCDWGDHTVKVLSSDGSQLLLAIRDPYRAIPCSAVCHQNMFYISYPKAGNVKVFSKDGVLLSSIGTTESGVRHLSFPAGITIDRFNNLVVCDRDKARLQLFTLDGKFVNSIEGQHIGLSAPYSVAVSSSGQLFVTSTLDKFCVYVFH